MRKTATKPKAAAEPKVVAVLEAKSFLQAAKDCAWVAGTRSPVHNLATLFIDGDMLPCLRAWGPDDLRLQVNVSGLYKCKSRLSFPAKDLAACLAQATGYVTVYSDARIEWKGGSVKFNLPSDLEDAYDQQKTTPLLKMTECDADALINQLKAVKTAISDDTSRQALTNVKVSEDHLVATDVHRMHIIKTDLQADGCTMPRRMVDFLITAKSRTTKDGTFEHGHSETEIGFRADDWSITAPMAQGQYPNWQRVVPSEHTRVAVFDRYDMIDAIKALRWLWRDAAKKVKFSFNDDKLTLTAKRADIAEQSVTIDIISKNAKSFVTAFNAQFILDALSAIEDDGAQLEMTENSRAAVLVGTGKEGGVQCIVMPMAVE